MKEGWIESNKDGGKQLKSWRMKKRSRNMKQKVACCSIQMLQYSNVAVLKCCSIQMLQY